MKRIIPTSVICLLVFFSQYLLSAEAKEPNRFIGLHDQLLAFEEGEIAVENGQLMVPIEKMARYLHADITSSENGQRLTIQKNGQRIAYDRLTGSTMVNGIPLGLEMIQAKEETLYIPIRFLGEMTGFEVDYIPTIRTARLTSVTSPHLNNAQFEEKVRNAQVKKQAEVKRTQGERPVVYLTFDDGPNKNTPSILETLKVNHIQGTFFLVGKQVNYFPELVQKIQAEGHSIGLHSMTHERSVLYASTENFMNEMNEIQQLIRNLTGQTSLLIRAPYGSYPYVTKEMRSSLIQSGYKLWDWNADPFDWKIKIDDYQQIVQAVKNEVEKAEKKNNAHIVILLHDREATAKALPEIIAWLKNEGFHMRAYDPDNHFVNNFYDDPSL